MSKEILVYKKKVHKVGVYSPSQVYSFNDCPRKYYYRYRQGIDMPPNANMLLGSACHSGFEKNYQQKIESKKDLPLDEIMDMFGQSFDVDIKQWEIIDWKDKVGVGKKKEIVEKKPEEIKDEGYRVMRVYRQEVSPSIQPIAVERDIPNMCFESDIGEILYRGRIDLIQEGDNVYDHKIVKSFAGENDVRLNYQVTSYAVGWSLISGKPIEQISVNLDYYVRNKEIAHHRCTTNRNQFQVELLKNMIKLLHTSVVCLEGINPETGKKYVNPLTKKEYTLDETFSRNIRTGREAWHCSPMYCGYYPLCMGEIPTVNVIRNIEKTVDEVAEKGVEE